MTENEKLKLISLIIDCELDYYETAEYCEDIDMKKTEQKVIDYVEELLKNARK